MEQTIDLNFDSGESYGVYQLVNDPEIMQYVSSANIACGFHAGDPAVMRKTVVLALENQVAIGAHPGLPDLGGFGRREMSVSGEEAFDMVVYQIGALWGFVRTEGGVLHHVKPHGALYNMACANDILAEAIAEAVYKIDPRLILYGLPGSELIKAGKRIGLRTAAEVFSDRTYQPDGTLTPRDWSNALITDKQVAAEQALRLVKEAKAETICIHGDRPGAVEFARDIHEKLVKEGWTVKPVSSEQD